MPILSDGKGLLPYTTASAMAEIFARCVAEQREAFAKIKAADELTHETFPTPSWGFLPRIEYRGKTYSFKDNMDDILWAYNLVAWSVIVEKINLRKILSSENQRRLNAALDTYNPLPRNSPDALPWLTVEAIQNVLDGWLGAMDDFLYELVREEYDFWKPHRERGFKSDKFEKLGERVIQTHAVTHSSVFDIHHATRPHVVSLDNIFHLLDGAGPLPGHNGPLVDAISVCKVAEKHGETDYFEFRCYLNGNLHLRFKRLDLLDKFNALAGRNYLGETKHKGNADDASGSRAISTLQG